MQLPYNASIIDPYLAELNTYGSSHLDHLTSTFLKILMPYFPSLLSVYLISNTSECLKFSSYFLYLLFGRSKNGGIHIDFIRLCTVFSFLEMAFIRDS